MRRFTRRHNNHIWHFVFVFKTGNSHESSSIFPITISLLVFILKNFPWGQVVPSWDFLSRNMQLLKLMVSSNTFWSLCFCFCFCLFVCFCCCFCFYFCLFWFVCCFFVCSVFVCFVLFCFLTFLLFKLAHHIFLDYRQFILFESRSISPWGSWNG